MVGVDSALLAYIDLGLSFSFNPRHGRGGGDDYPGRGECGPRMFRGHPLSQRLCGGIAQRWKGRDSATPAQFSSWTTSPCERGKGHEAQLAPDTSTFAGKEGPGAGEIELER